MDIWGRVMSFVEFISASPVSVEALDAERQREEARGQKLQEVLVAKKKLFDARIANGKLRKAIREVGQR